MKSLILILIAILVGSVLWSQEIEELIFWDFEDRLDPVYVHPNVGEASDISISIGDIEFMDGTDGGNSLIGFASDSLWTTDETFNPNNLPDHEKYIEFSFKTGLLHTMYIHSLEFRFGRNQFGPRGAVLQLSLDDFDTVVNTVSLGQITSEDPNNLNEMGVTFDPVAGLRYGSEVQELFFRVWPIGALEHEPEPLVFWDFQDRLDPAYVHPAIGDASDISLSIGDIEFMAGTDGGNSLVGFASDSLWTTDENFNPNNLPDHEKYIEFSIEADPFRSVYIDYVEFRFGRNEYGPSEVILQISHDNFNTVENTVSLGDITSENPNDLDDFVYVWDPAQYLDFDGVDELSFRLWPIGAEECDPDEDDDCDDAMLMLNNFLIVGYEDVPPMLMMNNFRVNGFMVGFPAVSLVLDRSGSMGTENFGLGHWPGAKQTAQNFVDGVMLNLDAVSVVSFAVERLVENIIHADVHLSNNFIGPAPGAPEWDDYVTRDTVVNNIENIPYPKGRTSIGSGILKGLEQLASANDSPGKAAMILITDGLDNWRPFARGVVPDVPDSVSIYTIGIGATNIDAGLLMWIAAATGGGRLIAPNAEALNELYAFIYWEGIVGLDAIYNNVQTIVAHDSHSHDIVVDDRTQKARFEVFSNEDYDEHNPLSLLDAYLISPTGETINANDALDNKMISYSKGFASISYEIIDPEYGVWELVVRGNNISEEHRYVVSAFANSGIKMDVIEEYDPDEETLIEEPYDLKVAFMDGDTPISGVQLTATIYPPEDDIRNRHYSRVENTPFADYEPENTIRTPFNRTRSRRSSIELTFSETEPGIYEATFYDTEVAGAYEYRIDASIDNQNYSFERFTKSFIYIAPPEPIGIPTLAQPEHEAMDVGKSPTFVWSNVHNAETYHFQLATVQDIIVDIQQLDDNHITLEDLEDVELDWDTDYTWRVKAVSGEDESYWSRIYSFNTGLPEIPTPHGLDGYIDGNAIHLEWNASPDDIEFYGPLYSFWVYRNGSYRAITNPATTEFVDRDIIPGQTYSYYIVAVYGESGGWPSDPSNEIEITVTSIEDEGVPLVTAIKGNYPNPFNPETNIMFDLAESSYTKITVYNISGQRVRTLVDEKLNPGKHSIVWNSQDDNLRPVSSGIYFIKMETEEYTGQRKILFLK